MGRSLKNVYHYIVGRFCSSNRNDFLKKMSIREFSKSASIYDSPGKYRMVKDDYEDVISAVCKVKFDSLLDCGCGTGNFIGLLANKGLDVILIGVDITPAMIEVAKEKNIKSARFYVCDCEKLDTVINEKVDVVTCIHSFHHYPNPDAFFESVKTILAEEGRLIIRDNACHNALSYWIKNHITIPFRLNLLHNLGDVHFYTKNEMIQFGAKYGFIVEELSIINGDTLHCIMRNVQ